MDSATMESVKKIAKKTGLIVAVLVIVILILLLLLYVVGNIMKLKNRRGSMLKSFRAKHPNFKANMQARMGSASAPPATDSFVECPCGGVDGCSCPDDIKKGISKVEAANPDFKLVMDSESYLFGDEVDTNQYNY